MISILAITPVRTGRVANLAKFDTESNFPLLVKLSTLRGTNKVQTLLFGEITFLFQQFISFYSFFGSY